MHSRSKKMIDNIKYSVLIKGLSMFVSFAMVRVLIDKLSPDIYGIWITLSSFLGMFSFFNIGMGNGMKNLLFSSIASQDNIKSKEIISTAYISLGFIVVPLTLISILIFPLFNWSEILSAPQDMSRELCILAIFVFSSLMIQLELSLIVNIMQAFQLSAYGDLINVLGQFFSLLSVIVIPYCFLHPDIVYYGMAIALIPVLVYFCFSLYLFCTKLKAMKPNFRFYNKKYLKELLSLGCKFFIIQIAALVMYQSSNLIIAHVSGSDQVTVYNVAYKYCGILQMIFTLMLIPAWSAAGDAYVNQDFEWIKNTIKRLNQVWLIFIGLSIIQLFFSPIFYKFWIGNSVSIGLSVTAFCIIYFILSMKAGIYCNIINGTGKIMLQFVMYILQAIVYIPLAIWSGRLYGIFGVLISMSLIQLINIVWMSKQCNHLINRNANGGIWEK